FEFARARRLLVVLRSPRILRSLACAVRQWPGAELECPSRSALASPGAESTGFRVREPGSCVPAARRQSEPCRQLRAYRVTEPMGVFPVDQAAVDHSVDPLSFDDSLRRLAGSGRRGRVIPPRLTQ